MSDIRKRVGRKGVTYQVRYPSKATKSGHAYATFATRKEALAFVESGKAQETNGPLDKSVRTVSQAIDRGPYAGVGLDFDGQPRPMGDGFDLGADEYPGIMRIRLPLVMKGY